MGNVRVVEALDKYGDPCAYLKQIKNLKLEDLDNTCLNKVTTGSGFTSMILTGHLKYVICVPFKSLILNKVKWCEKEGINVLAVFWEKEGGASDRQIKEFKGNKILVTWDSLTRLVNALGPEVGNYRIAIDESHKIIDAGAFRTSAIQDVIDCYKLFKAVILGTATPIDDKFMHHEFKNLDKITVKWHNLEPVSVKYSRYLPKQIHQVGSIIGFNHLSGIVGGNAHIFINSVTSIGKIIGLMKSQQNFDVKKIRVIASSSDLNREKLKRFSKLNIPISSINDDVKRINFYTSTAFEGCDIFDQDGKTYIITDGQQDCTKINITTQLPQIIGRIRDSRTKNQVELIYSPNRYFTNLTIDQFEEELKLLKKEAEFRIRQYKEGLSQTIDLVSYKADFANIFQSSQFIIERKGSFIFNELAWCNELHNYETIHKIYYVQTKEVEENGKKQKVIPEGKSISREFNSITYNYDPSPTIIIKGLNKALSTNKGCFDELCQEYIDLKEKAKIDLSGKTKAIEDIEPVLKVAYSQIGPQKMKALKFRKSLIDRELLLLNQLKSKELKVVELLNLREGIWISAESLKTKLQSVYHDLGLSQKVKATDITKYYTCKEKTRRENGDSKRGYLIVKSKFVSKALG